MNGSVMDLLAFTANMEHTSDIMRLAGKKTDLQIPFSDDGFSELPQCMKPRAPISNCRSTRLCQTILLHGTKAEMRKMGQQSIANHLEWIGNANVIPHYRLDIEAATL